MVCSVIFSEESFEYWDCYFVELPASYFNVVATGEIELESVCVCMSPLYRMNLTSFGIHWVQFVHSKNNF